MLLEESVYFLVVPVSMVTLPQQIDRCYMSIGKSKQFIRKENSISIIMHIQVINRKLVQPT